MPSSEPQVSIVIVTYNSESVLGNCLRKLQTAVDSIPFELIVIDNASSDNSVSIATEIIPEAKVIANKRNHGFAVACNQGAESAAGGYLLFLNPDVLLDADTVQNLMVEISNNNKVGLVSGRLRFADDSFQATCRRFPTILNIGFSRGSIFSRLFGGHVKPDRYTLSDFVDTTEVPAVAAALVMVRKSLFDQVGGFDSRFFMFMEDTDLSLRFHQLGYRNLMVPSAGGVHLWGSGSSTGRLARLRYHHISVWKYFLKHFPNGFSVFLLPVMLIVNFLLRLMLLVRRQEQQAI